MGKNFIEESDYIILMDVKENRLTLEEIRRFMDVGIKTIYYHNSVNVANILEDSDGYNFKLLDDLLYPILELGIKVLLPVFATPPISFVGSDVITAPISPATTLEIFRTINPSSRSSMNKARAFVGAIMQHYEKVQNLCCINAIPHDGEFLMPPYFKVDYTKELIVEFATYFQREFIKTEHKELWTALHRFYASPPFTAGNEYMEDIYRNYQDRFRGSRLFGIQFTHFIHGSWQTEYIAKMKKEFGIRYYCGSEYCEGMIAHTQPALKQGIRFITAPIHQYRGAKRAEPWMYDTVKTTIRTFEREAQPWLS